MKPSTLFILFLLFLPWVVYAKTYYCINCADCELKLKNAEPGSVVKLSRDITVFSDTCISLFGGDIKNEVVFDCQGHKINSSGHNGIVIGKISSRLTIRNCIFLNAQYGLRVFADHPNLLLEKNAFCSSIGYGNHPSKIEFTTPYENPIRGNNFCEPDETVGFNDQESKGGCNYNCYGTKKITFREMGYTTTKYLGEEESNKYSVILRFRVPDGIQLPIVPVLKIYFNGWNAGTESDIYLKVDNQIYHINHLLGGSFGTDFCSSVPVENRSATFYVPPELLQPGEKELILNISVHTACPGIEYLEILDRSHITIGYDENGGFLKKILPDNLSKTENTTPNEEAVCGNNIVEGDEECDGPGTYPEGYECVDCKEVPATEQKGKPIIEWTRVTPSVINTTGGELTFEIKVDPNGPKPTEVVINPSVAGIVWEKGSKLEEYGWVQVYDDGKTYGDEVAGDGIYTLKIKLPPQYWGKYAIDCYAKNEYGVTYGDPMVFEIKPVGCLTDEWCEDDEVCIHGKCEKAALVIGFYATSPESEEVAKKHFNFFMREFVSHTPLGECPEKVRFLFEAHPWYRVDKRVQFQSKCDYVVVFRETIVEGMRSACGFALPIIDENTVRIDIDCARNYDYITSHELGHAIAGFKDQYCAGEIFGRCGFNIKPNPLSEELGCPEGDYDGDGVPDCCTNEDVSKLYAGEILCMGNVGYSETEEAKIVYEEDAYRRMATIKKLAENVSKILSYNWSEEVPYNETRKLLEEINENEAKELLKKINEQLQGINKSQQILKHPHYEIDGKIIPNYLERSRHCISNTSSIYDLQKCMKEKVVEVPDSWVVGNDWYLNYLIEDGKISAIGALGLIDELDISFETRSIMSGRGSKDQFDENEVEILKNLNWRCE